MYTYMFAGRFSLCAGPMNRCLLIPGFPHFPGVCVNTCVWGANTGTLRRRFPSQTCVYVPQRHGEGYSGGAWSPTCVCVPGTWGHSRSCRHRPCYSATPPAQPAARGSAAPALRAPPAPPPGPGSATVSGPRALGPRPPPAPAPPLPSGPLPSPPPGASGVREMGWGRQVS